MLFDGHLEEAKVNPWLEQPQKPVLKRFVADLSGTWIEPSPYYFMATVRNLPHQIGKCRAGRNRRVRERRNILADFIRIADVDFELDPLSCSGESSQLAHEAHAGT